VSGNADRHFKADVASAAELFENAVVRDDLPDHWAEMFGLEVGQINGGRAGSKSLT
jgi:hypothetical protein